MKFMAALLLAVPVLCSAMTAKSYIVMDMDGNVVTSLNPDSVRPIASITKIFTTNRNITLPQDELITILADDVHRGRMHSSPLRAGMAVSRETLMHLALVSSDNIAAIALGRSESPEMQLPANTTIVEASGLDAGNRSTARDLAIVARSLYETDLATITINSTATIGSITRHSTNPLLDKDGWNFYLSKTGFTNPAGGCLVVITKVHERVLTFVILGSAGVKQRWRDLIELRQELGDSDFFIPVQRAIKITKIVRTRRHIIHKRH
jgi:D-alanyl-D-alanine endopeptidase (penicillin-binding protein 7)